MGDGRGFDGSQGGATATAWCNWADDPEVLQALLGEFRGTGSADGGDAGDKGEGIGDGKGVDDKDGEGIEGEEGEREDVHMHLSEVKRCEGCHRYFVLREDDILTANGSVVHRKCTNKSVTRPSLGLERLLSVRGVVREFDFWRRFHGRGIFRAVGV